jgi:hypothetical protein
MLLRKLRIFLRKSFRLEIGVALLAEAIQILCLISVPTVSAPRALCAQEFNLKSESASYGSDERLILPGNSVGGLSIGDSESKIFHMFPKPSIGLPGRSAECGTEYIVGLLQNARSPGFIRVFAKDGKVIQIEVQGADYHTAQHIGSGSQPEDVQAQYDGLESYLFLGGTSEALNMGPLILWIGEKKGIAFSFVYRSRNDQTFSVASTVVFKPGFSFCKEQSMLNDSRVWKRLPPYSLGPSRAGAETSGLWQAFGLATRRN